MKPIQVGLLGLGTVGAGTYEVLRRNQAEIQRRAGRGIRIAAVCRRDQAAAARIVGDSARVVADPAALVRDPELDIVVEMIGGLEPARTLVLDAIAISISKAARNRDITRVASSESPPSEKKLSCRPTRSFFSTSAQISVNTSSTPVSSAAYEG